MKRKVRVGGGVLEYAMSGAGQPAFVLINGSGGRTVLAYNRFGMDGSDKPTTPQTGRAIVEGGTSAKRMNEWVTVDALAVLSARS